MDPFKMFNALFYLAMALVIAVFATIVFTPVTFCDVMLLGPVAEAPAFCLGELLQEVTGK